MKLSFGKFLGVSYFSALVFEEIPRILFNAPHVWSSLIFVIYFLIEYGIIFTVAYFLFKNRKIAYPVIFGILFGLIWETFAMKLLTNPVIGIIYAILYGLMFYIPFKTLKVRNYGDKLKPRQVVLPLCLLLFVLFILASA